MLKSIKSELYIAVNKSSTLLAYFVMLAVIAIEFIENVTKYSGFDVNQMYQPMRLTLLSDDSAFGFYFTQYFPVFVILPCAFSYFDDVKSGRNIYAISRIGSVKYHLSKLISAFIVTFLVFFIPLMIEIMLNCIAIPMEASGRLSNGGDYDLSQIELEGRYLFAALWKSSPYIYMILNVFLFSILSGLLSVFALSFSYFSFVKLRVVVFIPVYLIFFLLARFQSIMDWKFSANYFDYLRVFSTVHKSYSGALLFVAVIACLTAVFTAINIKRRINL